MLHVPELTIAKRKPLIHAEAVAISNDTWQIHHQGGEPTILLVNNPFRTSPVDSHSADFTFYKQKLQCFIRRGKNSASAIYWSHVDYKINSIQMDWKQLQTAIIHRCGTCSHSKVFRLFNYSTCFLSVPCSVVKQEVCSPQGQLLCKQGRSGVT